MTAVRTRPVAVCVAVTVAPGSTAPLESVTRPFSSAVASCADATAAVRTRITTRYANVASETRHRHVSDSLRFVSTCLDVLHLVELSELTHGRNRLTSSQSAARERGVHGGLDPRTVHWCVLAAEESGYATGVFHIAAYL